MKPKIDYFAQAIALFVLLNLLFCSFHPICLELILIKINYVVVIYTCLIILLLLVADLLQENDKKDSLSTVQYVMGQRGSRKIFHEGYTYFCAKTHFNRKYWVCAKQRSRNCKARVITDANESFYLCRNQQHNHEPDHTYNEE